jgi:hypothetical protein
LNFLPLPQRQGSFLPGRRLTFSSMPPTSTSDTLQGLKTPELPLGSLQK